LFVDHEMRPTFCCPWHSPIAVGDLPAEHLADPCSVELAPPVALGDLGPFVLADHALDLGEQPGLGIVEVGRVDESDEHAAARQLVEDHDLQGVDTGEAVR
jgi:hypothetical protein